MAIMTPLKRLYVLRWVREITYLTQRKGHMLGARNRQYAPSKRPAEALREIRCQTRRANWPRCGMSYAKRTRRIAPPPAEVRNYFIQAQKGDAAGADFSPGGRVSEILPPALLFRAFMLQSLVADEFGPAGCRHTGFYDALQKMNAKLLWNIRNTKTRQRIFQGSRDMVDEDIADQMISSAEDLKEVTAAVRSSTKKTPLCLLVAIW